MCMRKMADWEEVRRLATDFQRIQASSNAHRLSERNCVELVGRLLDMGLVEVVHTLDGKEYVTPQYLEREIRDELTAHRGRINVVDLQQVLNVDLTHIESKLGELLRHTNNLVLIQGELIDRSYMNRLCEELNDTLQEVGQLSVATLSKNFGLPNDFLVEHIEASLGSKIKGLLDKTDSGVLYTDSYVARHRARIRGLFSAVTRPVAVGPILAQGGFQEKLFHTVLHELISAGELVGSLHGHLDKAMYIPGVYTQMQNRWIDSFLSASGYLEYDAMSRLGIDDPKGYISRRYGKRDDVIQLETCCLCKMALIEVDAALEEVRTSGGWVDIMPLIPTPCTPGDADLLLQRMCNSPQFQVFGSVVTTDDFIRSCYDTFQPLLKERAQEAAVANPTVIAEMSQRVVEWEDNQRERKKKGREKRGGKGRGREEDSTKRQVGWQLPFMTNQEIAAVLSSKFPDCPEEFIDSLTENLKGPLQEAFQEEAKNQLAALGQSPSASQQRKRHANLRDRVQGLWTRARLFEKAIAIFEGDACVQLSKYLLHTLCADLMNMMLAYLAEDSGQSVPAEEEMNLKGRNRVISNLPDRMKKPLTAVNNSLNGKDAGTFFQLFDKLCCEDYCGLMLKKLDKKRERQLQFSHLQSLLEHLQEEQDPAMILHLVVVILFQQHTNYMIHAPGKLVPSIVSFLADRVSKSEASKLVQYQQLVMLQLKLASKNSGTPSTEVYSNASNESVEPKLSDAGQEPQAPDNQNGTSDPETGKQISSADDHSTDPSVNCSVGEATVTMSESLQEGEDPEIVAQKLRNLSAEVKQLVVKPRKSDKE